MDDHISKGINLAKQVAQASAQLSEEQNDRSIRNALAAFSSTIARDMQTRNNPANRKTFLDRIAQMGNALSQSVATYDNSQLQAEIDNRKLIDFAQKLQRAEAELLLKQDEAAYRKLFGEKKLQLEYDKLEELKNYHKFKPAQATRRQNDENEKIASLYDNEFQPITKEDIKHYTKDLNHLGSNLAEIKKIRELYNTFNKKYSDNVLKPFQPRTNRLNEYIRYPVADYLAIDSIQKEIADKKAIDSAVNEFVISNERALKGGGIVGPGIIKQFREMGIYPNTTSDNYYTVMKKLDRLEEKLKEGYSVADDALKYKVKINPHSYQKFKEKLQNKDVTVTPATTQQLLPEVVEDIEVDDATNETQNVITPNTTVIMIDPETGERIEVPAEEQEIYLQEGYLNE